MKTRFWILLAACALLAIGITPVLAQVAPAITVAPIWTPGTQLTSANSDGNPTFPSSDNDGCYEPGAPDCGQPTDATFDDDVRYVTAEIWATASVPFWAMQMTCTVNPLLLEAYAWDQNGTLTPDDWGDGRPMVRSGDVWWQNGPQPAWVNEPFTATGAQTFTISRVGNGSSPLGGNGTNETLLLTSISYRVKTQLPAFVSGTSPLTCTGAFLDRDGKPVVAPVFKAPPPLTIHKGYVISGNVQYQARTAHATIGVQCQRQDNSGNWTALPIVNAAANGNFTVIARNQGWYECGFFGNIAYPAAGEQSDLYLRTWVNTNLQNVNAYTFLPVVMPGGNTDIASSDPFFACPYGNGQCSDEMIDQDDLNIITDGANWNKTGRTWATGDINGDTKTDKSDLAIVAGNYNMGETYWINHFLFSLPRDAALFQNSKVWVGDDRRGPVKPLVTPVAKTRDLWATLSPTGAQVAFIRSETPVAGQPDRYALWVVNADGKTALKRLTPLATAWSLNAFAPSWSPDGSKIAFVCSGPNDIPNDSGDICLVDANGNNMKIYTETQTHIFPPTWNWEQLIYGGQFGDPNCAGTICVMDPAGGYRAKFDDSGTDSIIVTPGDTADMPRMSDGRLIIRYTSVGQRTLRFIETNNPACTNPNIYCDQVAIFTPFTTTPRSGNLPLYTEVRYSADDNGTPNDPWDDTYLPVSTNVEFLEVSPGHQGAGIVFYENDGSEFIMLGGINNGDYNWGWDDPDSAPGDDGTYPYWNNPEYNRQHVYNQYPNLNPIDPLYYALRNAIDWAY